MSTPKHILVVDVEATCWEELPPNLYPETRNEIIEIGVAVVDIKERAIVAEEGIFVKPTTTSLSPFCTNLTSITPEILATAGRSFKDALAYFTNTYKPNRQIFASWGDYDRKSFEKNCRWNNVPYPFGNLHLNVKALFAAKFGWNGGQAKCGEHLGITMEGRAHRGVDDAVNIAKILLKLL